MPISQPLPTRGITLQTDDPDELSRVQPERQRSVVQLQGGVLNLKLDELVWGEAGIQSEQWSRGLRLQVSRPSSYVTFAFVTQGRARWMGAPIGPGSVLRIVAPWDLVSEGALEYVGFVVRRSDLESAALPVRDPDQLEMPTGNLAGRRDDAVLLAMRLLRDLNSLKGLANRPAALAAAGEELQRLALILDRPTDLLPVERFSSSQGRLAAIRRVEAYLEANRDAVPSIPTLCRIAGVSERSLEYAFREHLGVTPIGYLKLRRLMLVRRRLLNPEREDARVTEIVADCGVYELGRFAGEYRRLFAELPSETLARSSGHTSHAASRPGHRIHPFRSRRSSETLADRVDMPAFPQLSRPIQ